MKRLIAHAALAAGLFATFSAAHAAWPNDKPIELIVGFSPGGGTDVMARLIARHAEQRLPGSRFVVVNRPGAGGTIAFAEISQAKPDGYTIGMINVPGFNFLPLYRPTQYKPDDLHLLARVVNDPIVVFSKRGGNVPDNLEDIIKTLKRQPDSLSFGHSGDGTVGHIGLLRMQEKSDFKAMAIPFKGGSDVRSSVVGGHINYGLLTTGEVMDATERSSPYMAIAQLSEERTRTFDQIPTAKELGIDVVMTSERGFAAPKGMPPEIAERLERLLKEIVEDPAFHAAATADAPVLSFMPGAEWAAQIARDTEALVPLAAQMQK